MLQSRQQLCWFPPMPCFCCEPEKYLLLSRVITDPQPFFADEKVSMTTFPSNYSSKSNGAQKEASRDRSYFISLVLFRVAFFALFVCWLVLKTVKFPFIAGLSRPHSKPTEVDTKTLTSVKFESSFNGQCKIKTNSTVSNNVKHQAFIAPFMSRASVPSKDKQVLYANVGLASCSFIVDGCRQPSDGCGWEKPWAWCQVPWHRARPGQRGHKWGRGPGLVLVEVPQQRLAATQARAAPTWRQGTWSRKSACIHRRVLLTRCKAAALSLLQKSQMLCVAPCTGNATTL